MHGWADKDRIPTAAKPFIAGLRHVARAAHSGRSRQESLCPKLASTHAIRYSSPSKAKHALKGASGDVRLGSQKRDLQLKAQTPSREKMVNRLMCAAIAGLFLSRWPHPLPIHSRVPFYLKMQTNLLRWLTIMTPSLNRNCSPEAEEESVTNSISCPESARTRAGHVATKQGGGLSMMYLWRVWVDKCRGRGRKAFQRRAVCCIMVNM